MTGTEKATSEQRIYDRCIVRVGQLEAEKATLEARIDELCAENERLRVANAAFTGRSIRAGDKMACLEAENAKLREQYETVLADYRSEVAKLRELMSVMAYCNQFRRDCDGCSMNGAAGIITERAGCDELLDRMRELGIEVPDA